MIFVSQNVGQNDNLVAFLEQPHGNARDNVFHRDTAIHETKDSTADRCHGRRTVGRKNL